MFFKKLEKDLFLGIVEKTLNIQNNGGMRKIIQSQKKSKTDTNPCDANIDNETIMKSTGGVFFTLIRTESGISKQELKRIFKEDHKYQKVQKKTLQLIDQFHL